MVVRVGNQDVIGKPLSILRTMIPGTPPHPCWASQPCALRRSPCTSLTISRLFCRSDWFLLQARLPPWRGSSQFKRCPGCISSRPTRAPPFCDPAFSCPGPCPCCVPGQFLMSRTLAVGVLSVAISDGSTSTSLDSRLLITPSPLPPLDHTRRRAHTTTCSCSASLPRMRSASSLPEAGPNQSLGHQANPAAPSIPPKTPSPPRQTQTPSHLSPGAPSLPSPSAPCASFFSLRVSHTSCCDTSLQTPHFIVWSNQRNDTVIPRSLALLFFFSQICGRGSHQPRVKHRHAEDGPAR
jgi:hypothetical protein